MMAGIEIKDDGKSTIRSVTVRVSFDNGDLQFGAWGATPAEACENLREHLGRALREVSEAQTKLAALQKHYGGCVHDVKNIDALGDAVTCIVPWESLSVEEKEGAVDD